MKTASQSSESSTRVTQFCYVRYVGYVCTWLLARIEWVCAQLLYAPYRANYASESCSFPGKWCSLKRRIMANWYHVMPIVSVINYSRSSKASCPRHSSYRPCHAAYHLMAYHDTNYRLKKCAKRKIDVCRCPLCFTMTMTTVLPGNKNCAINWSPLSLTYLQISPRKLTSNRQ